MDTLKKIRTLIEQNKIKEADSNIRQLGEGYWKNPEYLILRAKIFKIQKIHYLAIDTLLIADTFEKRSEIYALLSEIYSFLENYELAKKFLNQDTAPIAMIELKKELQGIYKK